jgi:hypothetical protein
MSQLKVPNAHLGVGVWARNQNAHIWALQIPQKVMALNRDKVQFNLISKKMCVTCKSIKGINKFTKYKTFGTARKNTCIDCTRVNARKYSHKKAQTDKIYHAKNSAAYVKREIERQAANREINFIYAQEHKKITPCKDCYAIFAPVCMDFDHIDGTTKRNNISHSYHKSTSWFKNEINKCELVCSNCHRIRTKTRKQAIVTVCINSTSKKYTRRQAAYNYVRSQKLNKQCVDCTIIYDPVSLDFDHIHDDKIMDVSRMVIHRCSIKTIKNEINKCEIVCSNCHRIRTEQRKMVRT